MPIIETRKGGIFYGWWIVIVAMIGVSTSPQPFVLGSLGLFMKPFEEEFGWSRSMTSAGITVFTVATAICFPLIGRLIDRYGAKKILLPSMFFLALSLASIPLFVTEIWQFLIVFLLIGTLAAGSNTVSYMPVITAWFDKRRGLAIGLAISGIGMGFFYVPVLVQWLIDRFDWRAGYFGLSAVILLVAMPAIALFLKETPAAMGLAVDGDSRPEPSAAHVKAGLETREALRQVSFWLMMVTFIIVSFALNGMLTHLVPLLTDRGASPGFAATVASALGISVVIGRIGVGLLVDHFFAPRVAVITFGLSALGLLVLSAGASGAGAMFAAACIGLSLGAEIDLMAYLASRYFGLRAFASIYGILLSGILLGAGSAPVSFALWFDWTGSYAGVLVIGVVLSVMSMILMALLKPYPQWTASGRALQDT